MRRLDNNFKNRDITIVNLHRVSNDKLSAYTPLDVELFKKFLSFIKKNYVLTTFEDLSSEKRPSKPQMILTFDDGYKDFIEIVAPLLAEYKFPANQNVIPKSLLSGLPPLNVLAQDFIGGAPDELLRKFTLPSHPKLRFKGDRAKFALGVSKAIKMQSISNQALIQDPLFTHFHNFVEFKPTKMLSIADVNELKDSFEIGVHSYEHATMSFETDEYFILDMQNCMTFAREYLNLEPEIYTFPNGLYTEKQLDLILASKFKHILLLGDFYSKRNKRLHNRFLLHGKTLRELHFRLKPKNRFETFRELS
jgi:peptidoglycan/xylan/chitin deacetylase (PgdA/CDA1 family)